MSELAVILASHGRYAEGAMNCIEMVVGRQDNVEIISVTPEKGPEKVRQEVEEALKRLDTSLGVLAFVDIIGGTPCNTLTRCVLEREDIQLYAGFNMPVLIELFMNREQVLATAVEERLVNAFHASFSNINKMLKYMKGSESDANQLSPD